MPRRTLVTLFVLGIAVATTAVIHYWTWLQNNDIPNSVTFFLVAIVWPVGLWIYSKRPVHSIPNLVIRVTARDGDINGTPHAGINIAFDNQTGSVVYISNPRLLGVTRHFGVYQLAAHDISDFSYQLQFWNTTTERFELRQIILQTNQHGDTWMPLAAQPDDALLAYRLPLWRRFLNWKRYFRLEFLTVVGEKRFRVSLPY
jgi:hypothetical protein